MRNLYDFSDAQMSWLSCKNFLMDNMVINDDTFSGCDDEEDWFFPQPTIDVPEDITAPYKEKPEPALPPVIYLSGMDLNCQKFEKAVNLAEFESWDKFVEAFSRKYIYISVVDADNCDFDKAQDVLISEDIFEEILDNYKARL